MVLAASTMSVPAGTLSFLPSIVRLTSGIRCSPETPPHRVGRWRRSRRRGCGLPVLPIYGEVAAGGRRRGCDVLRGFDDQAEVRHWQTNSSPPRGEVAAKPPEGLRRSSWLRPSTEGQA